MIKILKIIFKFQKLKAFREFFETVGSENILETVNLKFKINLCMRGGRQG